MATTFRLHRDGMRDLSFTGIVEGVGTHGSGGNGPCDWTRGVTVSIYRTLLGQYVLARHFWSRWDGERDRYEARVHPDPAALLSALSVEGEDCIPPAELDAWHNACAADPDLATIECEEV